VFGCSLQGCKAVDPLKAERGVRQQPAALLDAGGLSRQQQQQAAGSSRRGLGLEREGLQLYENERFYGCFAPASRAAACLRSEKFRSQSGFRFQQQQDFLLAG
jgi:hypothetical protein